MKSLYIDQIEMPQQVLMDEKHRELSEHSNHTHFPDELFTLCSHAKTGVQHKSVLCKLKKRFSLKPLSGLLHSQIRHSPHTVVKRFTSVIYLSLIRTKEWAT